MASQAFEGQISEDDIDALTKALKSGKITIEFFAQLLVGAANNDQDSLSQLEDIDTAVELKNADAAVDLDLGTSDVSEEELSDALIQLANRDEKEAYKLTLTLLGKAAGSITEKDIEMVKQAIAGGDISIGGVATLIQNAVGNNQEALDQLKALFPSINININLDISFDFSSDDAVKASTAILSALPPKQAIEKLGKVFSGSLELTEKELANLVAALNDGSITIEFIIKRMKSAAEGSVAAFEELQDVESLKETKASDDSVNVDVSELDGNEVEKAMAQKPKSDVAEMLGNALGASSDEIDAIQSALENKKLTIQMMIKFMKEAQKGKLENIRKYIKDFSIDDGETITIQFDITIDAEISLSVLSSLSKKEAGKAIAKTLDSELSEEEKAAVEESVASGELSVEEAMDAAKAVKKGDKATLRILRKLKKKARRVLRKGMKLAFKKFSIESIAKALMKKSYTEQAESLCDALAGSSDGLKNSAVFKLQTALENGEVTTAQFLGYLEGLKGGKSKRGKAMAAIKKILGNVKISLKGSVSIRVDMETESESTFETMMEGATPEAIVEAIKETYGDTLDAKDLKGIKKALRKGTLSIKKLFKNLKMIANGVKFFVTEFKVIIEEAKNADPVNSDSDAPGSDSGSDNSGSDSDHSDTDSDHSDSDSGNSDSDSDKSDSDRKEVDPHQNVHDGFKCFPSIAKVQTKHNGLKMMEELRQLPNSQVLVVTRDNKLAYSPIYFWLHANVDSLAMFYELETTSKHSIRLSDTHLIYVVPCDGTSGRKAVFAESINRGDCILVRQEDEMVPSKVSAIKTSIQKGIYSPVTVEGSIVVDNIGASCYATYPSETLQHFSYLTIRYMYELLPQSIYSNLIGSWTTDGGSDIPLIAAATFEFSKWV